MNDWTHLADPEPIPRIDRSAVLARGRQVRRRRRTTLLGLTAVVAAAGLASALALTGQGDQTPALADTPGFVRPTNGPAPVAVSTPTDDRADGKPGWYSKSKQLTCTPTVFDDTPTAAPAPGLELSVTGPTGPVVRGSTIEATYTVTNTSDRTLSLPGFPGGELEAQLSDARTAVAVLNPDAHNLGLPVTSLLPGASSTTRLAVEAGSCADTSDEPAPAVPPGTYRVALTISVGEVSDDFDEQRDGSDPGVISYGPQPYRWTAVSAPFALTGG